MEYMSPASCASSPGEPGLSLDLRDDPLMRRDEFRLLSGRARLDVTSKYGGTGAA